MPHRAPEPLAPPTTVQSAPRLLRRADLLRDFLAVVNAGGIRAAAEQVHLSQSALTRRVQELERLLDVQLFERHALGMRLTR
ncbi:MAG: LysR family transcriptional regulator, partial [Rhodoferax sp.]|nr:LysR family transcriptional regulator [Rhodoferax sp.]